MGRHLFTVEDTFQIKGRGLVLVPGIVPRGHERFQVGCPITLRRPDGSAIKWTIGGLEMIGGAARARPDVPILLVGLSKEDLPIGTEVWSAEPSPDQH